MKYLSTKQAAERWGISPRRVALLASQGRIPGAASTGNTWIIPENAQKPADSRKKEFKNRSDASKRDLYPYIICMIHSDSQLNEFSSEEKDLYRACTKHEEGDFCASQLIAETLLFSENLNIRLGAQYLLAFSSMYQSDYASAEKYSAIFRNEFYTLSEPSPTIKLLFAAFEAEMGMTSEFVASTANMELSLFPTEMLPFVAGQKLYSELVKFNLGGKLPDIAPYEMMCTIAESDGYQYSAMYIHAILALFYAISGDKDKEFAHVKSAVEICVSYRFFFTLACMLFVIQDTMEDILSAFPDEVKQQIRRIIDVFLKTRNEYSDYLNNQSALLKLDENDCKLISYCLRNYSITKIAEILGLSRSGTNRRLAILYDKMGVKSMKEMKLLYLNSAFDWRE